VNLNQTEIKAALAGLPRLTRSSGGVVLADGTAASLSTVLTLTCTNARAYVFPGYFPLVLKLQQSGGTEMAATTEFAFAYQTASETLRLVHMGDLNIYEPWRDISTSDQNDADNQGALWVNLGIPYLAIGPQEKLMLLVYDASLTMEADVLQIFLPYWKKEPHEVASLIAARRAKWGS